MIYLWEIFKDFFNKEIEITPHNLKLRCEFTGALFTPWEYNTLLNMNAEFNHQVSISKDPKCPDPLLDEEELKTKHRMDLKKLIKSHSKG